MRLTDIFQTNSQLNSQTIAQTSGQQTTVRNLEAEAARQLQELKPGQIIKGQIVSEEGSQAQVKLLNDLLIHAKLDKDGVLELGKLMNFQVRSNGKTLALIPLQTNMSVDAPVTKALDMAGIPVNSATGEMTKLMMQAGMSVNKENLQQMYREMVSQTAGDISDLVDLHRLGLEVNEENLNQMSSYKNLTHQLMSGLTETSEAFMEVLDQQLSSGETTQAANLYQETLNILTESEETADLPAELQQILAADRADALAEKADPLEALRQALHMTEPQPKEETEVLTPRQQFLGQVAAALDSQDYSPAQKTQFAGEIIRQALQGEDHQLLKDFVSMPEAKRFLGEMFQKQWSITPEQVADQKEVENLYGRLERQLKGVARALESAGQAQSPAFEAATNMNQNLDFLQQVNQMYAYVQLPLRLQQGQAHGDLYVYTNKKNLSAKDGPISALLHLDMEHLGPVDVYVSMQMEKVNTKFYVQDDEMLDFLEAHMDILTQRLEKRGYHMDVQMTVKEPGKDGKNSGIEPILEAETPGMVLQTKGFDVRT